MKKRGLQKVVILCVAVVLSGAACACADSTDGYLGSGGHTSAESQDMSVENYDNGFRAQSDALPAEEAPAADENEEASHSTARRKLIKTVEMTVETKEYDSMLTQLEHQVEDSGGYVEKLSTYNGSIYSDYRDNRNASMTIRIPRDRLDVFIESVSGIGNIISRNDSVEDITLTYVDLESHKNALQTEQERLLELLEQAETLEDIIAIEERLSNVRYQIQSMESQLRTYDNQVDYSTVYLELREVTELTPVEEQGAWERMISGFTESIRNIGYACKETIIWLAVHLPYLLVWTTVAGLVILVIHRSRKRKKKKNAANQLKQIQGQENQEVQDQKQT